MAIVDIAAPFPEGASVSVYPYSGWGATGLIGAPTGAAITGPQTIVGGVAKFNLPANNEYVAYSNFGGKDYHRRVSTIATASPSPHVPLWQPNTYYPADFPVSWWGRTWTAKVAFTSAATFAVANWNQMTNRVDIPSVAVGVGAETDDRRYCATGHTMPAGDFRGRPIHLVPGTYSNVTVCSASGTPSTVTNAFFGLYPLAGGAPLASSADVSATFNGLAAGAVGTVAMAFTCTVENDYIIGLLIGGAAVFPVLIGPSAGGSTIFSFPNLTPRTQHQHSATGLTALPNPLTPTAPTSNRHPWFRYD